MIVEKLFGVLVKIYSWFLSFLDIPPLPDSVLSLIETFMQLFQSGFNLVDYFLPVDLFLRLMLLAFTIVFGFFLFNSGKAALRVLF